MEQKHKLTKKTPKLDMNPMVDLAFLLVTFFMLTTTFKASEPFEIVNPSATSEVKLPSKDILTISFDVEGRIFVDLDNMFLRGRWLNFMANQYNLTFTEAEIQAFSLMNSVGVPMVEMKDFLEKDAMGRSKYYQQGIPISQDNNELRQWILYARAVNPMIRITINGDENAHFKYVDAVIKTLTGLKIHRFNLITDKEKALI